ncbi:MAG: phytoene/squalene synthase family protein [Acidobacteriaceae bacterium]
MDAPSVDAAYQACEAIARREAKNFYYAFRVLPKAKREAMCAVYAFMRHADDLADEEDLPREQRLLNTQKWVEQWHRAAHGEHTGNPVFIALRDAQQRFHVETDLLDQLVQGTMMDLTAPMEPLSVADREFAVYRTFDDLYRYCYYVASVVGLVCIRIFGYTDGDAEKLAEQTGIAFQLTNILRDVREDADHGRIYLPLEDLEKYNVTAEQLSHNRSERGLTPEERGLMEMEAARAHRYYAAADRLLPLIAPDGRAALWVLVSIYRRLLERIEAAQYEVFSGKIKVPTTEKLWILMRGFWMSFRLRFFPSRTP